MYRLSSALLGATLLAATGAQAQTAAETRATVDALTAAGAHHQADTGPAPAPAADPHAGHVMAPADAAPMATMDHAQHGGGGGMTGMTGGQGSYPMERDGSGTSWRPDASEHMGYHTSLGPWMLMGHALLNGVSDWQGGPRGDTKGFVSGMLMGMAKRDWKKDSLQLRIMASPEPFMGKSGFPVLLASGETADGVNALVDRQHPHDLFMELSATWAHRITARDSVYLYAGWPGEPAFGPSAFMHRQSIMDSPEAPISHHWLDSTHISYGVLTAGYVHDNWKIEVSRYTGREPDETRFDLDHPKLDSTAVRFSWNPSRNLALQASFADAKSVEQLEPEVDQRKWSLSAIYTRKVGNAGWWSTTAAWGRRSDLRADLDAWILESALQPNAAWTLFGRAELTENNELSGHGHHGPVETVGKVSLGAIRDWRVHKHAKIGIGGLYSWNRVSAALAHEYGGRSPEGAMGFVRLKID